MSEATTQAIVARDPAWAPNAITPMDMLNQAVERGANIDVLTKLMDLQERWERNQARKAFDAALAAAKAEIPPIRKNRVVDFTSQKGRTNYRHEDLGEIAATVDPILARHGLSYRFRTEQLEGGSVRVVCVLAHREGHVEENALTAGRDESGNKNNIQAVGSTVTYLQRYTLKAALGLAASNDDDGRSAGAASSARLSDEQIATLQRCVMDAGASLPRLMAFLERKLGVTKLEDIPAAKFDEVVEVIRVMGEQAKQRAAQ